MKVFEMRVVEEFNNQYIPIMKGEFPGIELDHKVTTDEFNYAIDTIITYYAQNGITFSQVRLQEREEIFSGKLKKIEKALGFELTKADGDRLKYISKKEGSKDVKKSNRKSKK